VIGGHLASLTPSNDRARNHLSPRVRSAHPDPRFKVGDDTLGQASLGRHFQILIAVANRLQNQTALQLARHHRRSSLTTTPQRLARIDPQSAFGLPALHTVTLVATLHEDRPDAFLEEFQFGHGRGFLTQQRCHEDGQTTTDAETNLGQNPPGKTWKRPSLREARGQRDFDIRDVIQNHHRV
jgi:hypothetical protein